MGEKHVWDWTALKSDHCVQYPILSNNRQCVILSCRFFLIEIVWFFFLFESEKKDKKKKNSMQHK